MKRETIKDQINEDGSHTRIEKITQTPEDGFVSNREHRPSWETPDHDINMFGRGKSKGYKTTITYWKSHTKKTRVLFYIAYILIAMIFTAIFIGLISVQDSPEDANKYKLYFAGVVVFLVYGFVKSIMSFRKQDQQREGKHTEGQQAKD